MRNRVLAGLLILVMVFANVTVCYAEKNDDDLDLQATTAVVYSGGSGEVIWGLDENKKMNPASMTKMMTGLLAVENLDLDTVVTIGKGISDPVYSGINFVEGEEVKVEDLLYAAMLASSNSAATALAVEVAGSVEDFTKMMNDRAAEIGCKGTNFANAHGLKDKNNYSTCYDMALICEEAFANQKLSKISTTEKYTIAPTNKSENKREFKNTNYLLYGKQGTNAYGTINVKKYEGIFGAKTGTAENSEGTMAAALEHEGKKIYAVVMGSKYIEKFYDIEKLLDYGKEHVNLHKVFDKGTTFEKGKVWGGATNKVTGVATETGYINLPEGASKSLISTKAVYDEKLEAPIKKGQIIGKVEIYLAEEKTSEVKLSAAEAVEKGWPLSAIRITNTQTIILMVIAGLVVVFFIMVIILRIINKRKRKKRRQRKIMEMAMRELEREQDYKQRNWPY